MWITEVILSASRHVGLLLLTIYVLTRRTQHRKLVLKMQLLNKLMGMEKKLCYQIDYPLVLFLAIIIGLISTLFVLIQRCMDGKLETGAGRLGSNYLSLLIFCFYNYITFILARETQQQHLVLNQRINNRINNLASNLNVMNIKRKMRRISELFELRQMVITSSRRLSSFSTPFHLTHLYMAIVLLITRSESVFVLVRYFVLKTTLDLNMGVVAFISIAFTLIYLQFVMSMWVDLGKEVR
ncbi:hypothetical protein QE152_g6699 [Popillia japonica]|uniref:Gustatory receptor n=1 Tax=Popillia japonica TaxID=7064 RepID=A0AAW1MHH7_POPJA